MLGESRPGGPGPGAPAGVFINYRRDDSGAAALLLYERLAVRFGESNVFLDVKSLAGGTRWLDEIKSRGARGGVMLALIGPHWLAGLTERRKGAEGEPQDYVLLELEFALGRWGGIVIPVLLGGASMPDPVSLPRPVRGLADREAVELRLTSFDKDVANLIQQLETPASDASAHGAAGADGPPPARPDAHTPTRGDGPPHTRGDGDGRPPVRVDDARGSAAWTARPALPAPDDAHFEVVLDCMVEEGTLVPLLGSAVHGTLPDAEQLAAHLAGASRLQPGTLAQGGAAASALSLAAVAQHVATAQGPSFLHRAMKDAFRLEPEINDLHRFLAALPAQLERARRPARYQMIVTTNYDSALERAFDAEGEPYDLAVFVAGGADKGRFVHVPWKGEPRAIAQAGTYRDFPIDPYDELERTVIVKIHGAADAVQGDARWGRSYMVTEDQYIEYLVTEQIASVVPLQILNKLTSSHCLFLGYPVREWSLRVFLKRIWQGRPLEDRSWAIERDPDRLEKDLWGSLNVELLAAAPDAYARDLQARLTRRTARARDA